MLMVYICIFKKYVLPYPSLIFLSLFDISDLELSDMLNVTGDMDDTSQFSMDEISVSVYYQMTSKTSLHIDHESMI